jgi:hypothetical protein
MTEVITYHSYEEFEKTYFPNGYQVDHQLKNEPKLISNSLALELLDILKKK